MVDEARITSVSGSAMKPRKREKSRSGNGNANKNGITASVGNIPKILAAGQAVSACGAGRAQAPTLKQEPAYGAAR